MKNDEFETPQWLFDELDKEFHFDLDVAANYKNSKCDDSYYSIENTGLDRDWSRNGSVVWMNPPYSRGQLDKWCKKAYKESQKGVTVVGLLPVDTSTKWFHEWIYDKQDKIINIFSGQELGYIKYNTAIEIRFLNRRLKFELNGIPQGTARFSSMIVIWRGIK
jgi:phage N-6-adenine-methyltransferase